MVKNHIELYAKEVNDLWQGETVTVIDRDGNEVTIRMKPEHFGYDESKLVSTEEMARRMDGDLDDYHVSDETLAACYSVVDGVETGIAEIHRGESASKEDLQDALRDEGDSR